MTYTANNATASGRPMAGAGDSLFSVKRLRWLWFGLFVGLATILVVVFACVALFQHGSIGVVLFTLMAGGFLISYNVYSITIDVAAVGFSPRPWHTVLFCVLLSVPFQLLLAMLPLLLIRRSYLLGLNTLNPIGYAVLGWLLGIVITRPTVRKALEKYCSAQIRRSGRKRGRK